MPQATAEQTRDLSLIGPAPGEKEPDPKTRAVKLATLDNGAYRRLVALSEPDKAKIKKLMKSSVEEWKRNTSQLNNKLRRNINRMEGITGPKDFPWPGASNINIPFTEIQILIASSVTGSTMLDNDPVWVCKELIPASRERPEEHVDPNIEWFLNWVAKQQLHLDDALKEVFFLAFRDPMSLAVLDWVEELRKEFRIEIFESVDDLKERFQNAEAAGVSEQTYNSWLAQLGIGHESLQLRIEEIVVKFRGPQIRIVELKDFVRAPVGSPDLGYTIFHGDQFRQRGEWFKVKSNRGWFYKEEVARMLESAGKKTAMDDISRQLDIIEGIDSTRITDPDEYDCVRGNLRIALGQGRKDDAGKYIEYPEEALYHVVYHPETDSLLRVEQYPYWHNRSNYIPFRIRKRPNRLLGRCFTDMLYDINEEINTQHNQKIDSRTITTVPSFKVQQNEIDLLSLIDRKAQHFYPGVVFRLSSMKNMEQLDTKVDFQGTTQEEQSLMSIGEMLTGASSLRSGRETPRDPRAPAKKTRDLIGQSNQRIDDFIRELRGSVTEVAEQVLELYYQFSPDSVIPWASFDEATQKWVRNEMQRAKLRNRNMTIEVARTSVADNPDQVLQRALTDYQIWSKEPMVGGNIARRWELVRDTMFAEKKKNINKLLPPLPQLLQEVAQQQQLNDENSPKSLQDFYNGIQSKTGKSEKKEPNGTRQGSPDNSPEKLNREKKG